MTDQDQDPKMEVVALRCPKDALGIRDPCDRWRALEPGNRREVVNALLLVSERTSTIGFSTAAAVLLEHSEMGDLEQAPPASKQLGVLARTLLAYGDTMQSWPTTSNVNDMTTTVTMPAPVALAWKKLVDALLVVHLEESDEAP